MDYCALGEKIKNLRKQDNVSQQTLADAVGVSRATINALERGRTGDVGIRKVMKILCFFNCELDVKQMSLFPTFEELLDEQ